MVDNYDKAVADIELVDPPLQINPSTAPDHLKFGVRDIVIVIGALSTILGFASKRDIGGLMNWLQSSEAFPFLGIALMVGSFVWNYKRVNRKKAELVTLGLMAPNSAAVVLGVDDQNKA